MNNFEKFSINNTEQPDDEQEIIDLKNELLTLEQSKEKLFSEALSLKPAHFKNLLINLKSKLTPGEFLGNLFDRNSDSLLNYEEFNSLWCEKSGPEISIKHFENQLTLGEIEQLLIE